MNKETVKKSFKLNCQLIYETNDYNEFSKFYRALRHFLNENESSKLEHHLETYNNVITRGDIWGTRNESR